MEKIDDEKLYNYFNVIIVAEITLYLIFYALCAIFTMPSVAYICKMPNIAYTVMVINVALVGPVVVLDLLKKRVFWVGITIYILAKGLFLLFLFYHLVLLFCPTVK
jgi:hypothetical protein